MLRAKRDALSLQRRQFAAENLYKTLYPLLKPFPLVLSFNSFPKEIDLSLLNDQLKKEDRVLFPEQLDMAYLSQIFCILVPGLGFDSNLMRIGYGKGYYDRLLILAKTQLKWGIGFKEQMLEENLPCEPHDQKLDTLYVF